MVGGILNIQQYSITLTALRRTPRGRAIYLPHQDSFNITRCLTPFPVETPLMTTDLYRSLRFSTLWTNTLRNCILWWRFCFCYFLHFSQQSSYLQKYQTLRVTRPSLLLGIRLGIFPTSPCHKWVGPSTRTWSMHLRKSAQFHFNYRLSHTI